MLLLAIVAFGVPLAINLRGRVNAEVRTQALAQADLVAATAADLLRRNDRGGLQALAQSAAGSLRGRVLILDRQGRVLVDSEGPAQVGVSYASRPEVRAALAGRQIQLERYSRTLGQELLASAAPIIRNSTAAGVVRVTQSVASVQAAVLRVELGLGLVAVIVLTLGLGAGVVIAAQIAGPVQRLQRVARRIAQGDLTARAKLEGSREQRSLAGSFNEMTQRIARLLEAQRKFVADASHQLRTPLTALRLRLEEARAESTERAAIDELDAAIAEVDRLSKTVEELLVLSGAGERRPEGAAVDLHELAAATVQRWRPHAQERGIAMAHRRRGAASSVWAARADLERVLDVLVENAVTYAPRGTVVTVTSNPGRIDVQDQGPGIDPEERELVFERFHRGRAGRAGLAGSGLGLAIARELARAWGGEVEITAGDGRGACVGLTLPPDRPTGDAGAPLPALNQAASSVDGR